MLRALRKIYIDLSLFTPQTVLVDKDQALINALESVFPDAKVLLCIWHINKNILVRAALSLQRALIPIISQNDPQFVDKVNKKWKEMLSF